MLRIDDARRAAGDGASAARDYLGVVRARLRGTVPPVMPLFYVEVTRACNLRCRYCGFASDYPARGRELDAAELCRLLDEARGLGARIVSFGGGEPLLRRDLPDVLAHAAGLGLAVHVDTNGTLVDDRFARVLAALPSAVVALSLDHPDPARNDDVRGEGTHAAVASAVACLRELAPDVGTSLNCVVGRHNRGRLEGLVALAARWGVDSVKFSPAQPTQSHRWRPGGVPDDVRLGPDEAAGVVEELLRARALATRLGLHTSSSAFLRRVGPHLQGTLRYPCAAGYAFGNVDPYGNLFPCYEHLEPLDVRAGGLAAAWRGEAMQRMRERVRSCRVTCWCTGSAEPSIRMRPWAMLAEPGQALDDLRFYLRKARRTESTT
jgi:pyrroloquinoline quinone biosynthesis protein E